ncbi:MAG: HD-GYP domain-containing protein [Bacillota bacterium]
MDAGSRVPPASFEQVIDFSRRLDSLEEVGQLYDVLVRWAASVSRAARAELWVREPDGTTVRVRERVDAAGAPPSQGGQPEGVTRSEFVLASGGQILGQLLLEGLHPAPELVRVLTAQAAATMAYLQARRNLKRNLVQVVTALAALVEGKDQYTEDHCHHMAELALQLGIRMGLPPGRLDQLTYAAILHDIGKVGVPDQILGKKGPLTESEWELMRQHPTIGAKVLERIDFLKDAAEIVEQHHERYDGTGYPKGLAGEAIRLEARILAVVDAYDAMVTTRPYRKAMTRAEAVEELRRCAGNQFDPAVVQALIDTLRL